MPITTPIPTRKEHSLHCSSLPSRPQPQILRIPISELNDLDWHTLTITSSQESSTTRIEKQNVANIEARIKMLTNESDIRIEIIHKEQDGLMWRLKHKCVQEREARVKAMKQESEAVLQIMLNENRGQIEVMEDEGMWRSIREGEASSKEMGKSY